MTDNDTKTLIESGAIGEEKSSSHVRVIAKLVGARDEVEDVLISSTISSVLSAQEKLLLGRMTGTIDDIVRRIEQQ
jgi:hypothetical protein